MLKVALGIAIFASPAWAALGQSAESVKADQERLGGVLRTQEFVGYTIHEISQPDGRVVREYVSRAGVVFGVVWEGPFMPNLSQLLGPYFEQFQKAATPASDSPRRRGPLYVQTGMLVVASGGHMRSFHGRAYLINLIPAGLTEAVLR
jgi:hypothetical protein